jgi:hypothetical protein
MSEALASAGGSVRGCVAGGDDREHANNMHAANSLHSHGPI